MTIRNIAECIIVNKEGEILLQKKTLDYKKAPGQWCLFGGEIEKEESPERAMIRELNEELKFKPEKIELFEVYDYALDSWNGKGHVFIAEFLGKLSDLRLGEGAGFAFFNASELDSLNIARMSRKVLGDYLS